MNDRFPRILYKQAGIGKLLIFFAGVKLIRYQPELPLPISDSV